MADTTGFRRFGVIMAGGSGERFWPLSRRDHPKQLLHLTHENESMLGEAVARLSPLIPPERILVVTGEHLVEAIRAAGVGVPDENVLAEPCKRNTAGCLTYAAAHILAREGGDGAELSMAVVTADHVIEDAPRFLETVRVTMETAEKHEVLATHGIVPTRVETGYGYIQSVDRAAPLAESNGISVYPVAAFHEKPSREKAEDFIATGRCYWNSGMFFWRVDTFMTELEKASPAMARAARAMAQAMSENDKGTVRAIFETLEDISIDYALMEHAEKVVVTRADYPWDDVGAWTALDRTRARDAQDNVAHGDPILVDCHDCIVYNDAGPEGMAVGVVGGEQLVVVVSKDAVLVVPKDRAQDVRHVVKELRARNADQV